MRAHTHAQCARKMCTFLLYLLFCFSLSGIFPIQIHFTQFQFLTKRIMQTWTDDAMQHCFHWPLVPGSWLGIVCNIECCVEECKMVFSRKIPKFHYPEEDQQYVIDQCHTSSLFLQPYIWSTDFHFLVGDRTRNASDMWDNLFRNVIVFLISCWR